VGRQTAVDTAPPLRQGAEVYVPTAPHAALARLIGTWDHEIDFGDGATGTVRATGRVTNRAILGGRFIVSEGEASNTTRKLDYGSTLIYGFDGRSGEHTVIVLDSFGTYFVTAAGRPGSVADLISMRGQTMEGGRPKHFTVELQWLSTDRYTTQILFHLAGRDPVVALKATHRRVSAGVAAGPSGGQGTAGAKDTAPKVSIAQLSWLVGNWTGSVGQDSSYEETWTPAAGGTMLSVSRTLRGDTMRAFEFIRIFERQGGLVYAAMPNGRGPATEFLLTKIGPNHATFENPAHDFPKVIRYGLNSDGILEAVISDGGQTSQTFRMTAAVGGAWSARR
jgi:hypothetical protein